MQRLHEREFNQSLPVSEQVQFMLSQMNFDVFTTKSLKNATTSFAILVSPNVTAREMLKGFS